MSTPRFTTADFAKLGVCGKGLDRVAAFGGAIDNTSEGWTAYVAAYPDAWRAPVFIVWSLHRRGLIACPDLIWRIARIAFREQPAANAQLRIYAQTLGSDWREAVHAAYAAHAAADAAADAAHAAYAAADAAGHAAAYAAAHAAAHAAADAARGRVRTEIIGLAVAALVH